MSTENEDRPIPKLKIVSADTVIEYNRTPLPSHRYFRSRDVSEASVLTIQYVVKGLVEEGCVTVVYGAPGEGKTFVALDMGCAVANGGRYLGKLRTRQGVVLYLAFENAGSIRRRLAAIRKHTGADVDNLLVVDAKFNLATEDGRNEVSALIQEVERDVGKPRLVIMDTWARMLGQSKVDENDATTISAIVTMLETLAKDKSIGVVVIAHPGKNPSKGVRGSSALLGAIDGEIHIEQGKIKSTKQRSYELLPDIGFKLEQVFIGVDSDGDRVTSCVVLPHEDTAPVFGAVPEDPVVSAEDAACIRALQSLGGGTKSDWTAEAIALAVTEKVSGDAARMRIARLISNARKLEELRPWIGVSKSRRGTTYFAIENPPPLKVNDFGNIAAAHAARAEPLPDPPSGPKPTSRKARRVSKEPPWVG